MLGASQITLPKVFTYAVLVFIYTTRLFKQQGFYLYNILKQCCLEPQGQQYISLFLCNAVLGDYALGTILHR